MVIASVAMLRLTSVIRFSRSKLQVVTDMGCVMATLFNVRTAANLSVGRGELRNSCNTVKQDGVVNIIAMKKSLVAHASYPQTMGWIQD